MCTVGTGHRSCNLLCAMHCKVSVPTQRRSFTAVLRRQGEVTGHSLKETQEDFDEEPEKKRKLMQLVLDPHARAGQANDVNQVAPADLPGPHLLWLHASCIKRQQICIQHDMLLSLQLRCALVQALLLGHNCIP